MSRQGSMVRRRLRRIEEKEQARNRMVGKSVERKCPKCQCEQTFRVTGVDYNYLTIKCLKCGHDLHSMLQEGDQ